MSRHTTPRPMTFALVALLFAALATPSCSLIGGSSGSGGAGKSPVKVKPKPAVVPVETTTAVEPAEVQVVDGAGLRDLGSQDAVIVDIRSKADFDLERLPDAKNVPMPDFTTKAATWAEDEPIVVYGSGDAKAQTAAAWLVRNGFQQVYRLKGGIEAYDGERDGPLGKYRFKKPTVVYVYSDTCAVCAQASPQFDKLKKEYGKKVDFEKSNASLFKPVDATDVFQVVTIEAVPTFILIESDPRTYRKVVGLNGLQTLYGWLQDR